MAEKTFKKPGAAFTLSWEGERPSTIGLYIWELPDGDLGNQILKDTIAEITGQEVAYIYWWTGNGHGSIEVVYEADD